MNLNNQIREVVVPIKGMHCRNCVELIESEIGALRGVEFVKVSLLKNNVVVRFDHDRITLPEIRERIISLGYSPGGTSSSEKGSGFFHGLVYGLIPHVGCFAFIAASVIGATATVNVFKPLLMNPYFFYILVGLSLTFATTSSVLYLRRNDILSLHGVRRKWKHLSVMFTSSVGVNVLVFMVVFPLLAQVTISGSGTVIPPADYSSLTLRVDIPCPGHAPLILEELQSLNGVVEVEFRSPNMFDVVYDPAMTTERDILSLPVFAVYRATVEKPSEPRSVVSREESLAGSS